MQKDRPKVYCNALLNFSEIHYKFADAINMLYNTEKHLPKLPYAKYTWGRHSVKKKDMQLTAKDEKLGAMFVSHCGLFLLATQMDSVLDFIFGQQRFSHNDEDIKSASHIVRLMRNAFTHNPFHPIWLIGKGRRKIFFVNGIIRLDASKIRGKSVRRSHYGGSLAILKLLKYIQDLNEVHNR